jgi:hypothetical protein
MKRNTKLLLTTLLLAIAPAHAADNLDCLTRVIHKESRGEPLEYLAVTARSAVNRARDGNICKLITKGVVQASSRVPDVVKPYFVAIAKTAMTEKTDIANGANSWNTGRKPAYRGKIKRASHSSVYYTMENLASN